MTAQDWTEREDYPIRAHREVVDPILRLLAMLPETGALMSMSIALATPGGLIHGMLVSQAEWYDEWFKNMASGGDGNLAMSRGIKGYLSTAGRLDKNGAVIDHEGSYLHLRNAIFYGANGPTNPILWRVNITSIFAWSLGAPAQKAADD